MGFFGKVISKINKDASKQEALPDTPYGPKISSITDAGIEFYWKKVEVADGYEIFRAYEEDGDFKKIGENNSRGKGVYTDNEFDHDKKKVFYKSRSYLESKKGKRSYSDFTNVATASYREELLMEREVTYMYSETERSLRAFAGWGQVPDAKWSSSNEEIATVDQEGNIHAVHTGEAVLTCVSESLGKEATTRVVVNRKSLEPLDTGERRFSYDPATKMWTNPSASKSNDALVMMVGDMMCGSTQTKKQFTEEHGYTFNDSYEFVKNTTAESDFAIGNLETLMAPGWPYMIDESYINNQNNCNNPSRYLDAVLYGGFDGVTMANNHNCDGGVRALLETIDEVELRNIPYTGVFKGLDDRRYMIVDINGIKVGFLAYMSRFTTFNGKDADWTEEEKISHLHVFTPEKAMADIEACKADGAEYIIAYMHWGQKNYKSITKKQIKEAQEAADAGVDYIVGANPHMVQVYDDITAKDGRVVPCFYSTGNFQAYMNQIPGNRDSVMVRIRLKKENDKVVLAENGYIPYHTYKSKEGCFLAPMATSEVYDQELPVSGRKKYYQRITEAVGDKVKAL